MADTNSARPRSLDAARDYVRRGWCPIPIPVREKGPVVNGWPELRLQTEDDLRHHFGTDPGNIGVLLGTPSGDLVDVDLDCREARLIAADFLPATGCSFGRHSAPWSHWLYVARGATHETFKDPTSVQERSVMAELRATKQQTVFPPSEHPSGELITFHQEDEPGEVLWDDLRTAVARLAAGALLVRHYPAKGERQEFAMALAGALLRSGFTVQEVKTFLRAVASGAFDDEVEKRVEVAERTAARIEQSEPVSGWPRLSSLLGEPKICRVIRRWIGSGWDAIPGMSLDDLPGVILTNVPLRHQSDQALSALAIANDPPFIFVRDKRLVQQFVTDEGRAVIRNVGEAETRGILTRSANFVRVTRTGGALQASPPNDLVRDVISRGSWGPDFPVLNGLVSVPVMRPDGTILNMPGYDPQTGLLFCQATGSEILEVSASPNAEQASSALALIDDAFGDMPCISDAARANLLALFLTPLLRPAITGRIPLCVIDAPQQGNGKSLLAECISVVVTGQPAAMMTAPGYEEEWRKQITSTLLEGPDFVVIDNVINVLDSAALATVITGTSWKDRLLGRNEMANIPSRATWVVTGNNVRLGGDMPRRSYRVRLDAETARPWRRAVFKHHDLSQWVADHRSELVGAGLTLGRAWFAAGCPKDKSLIPLGGFTGWAETIGGVLMVANVRGFLSDLDAMYGEDDNQSVQWERFLFELHHVYGATEFTAAGIADKLFARDGFRQVLPDDLHEAYTRDAGMGGFVRKLGKALSQNREVRFGGADLYLLRSARTTHHQVNWSVAVGKVEELENVIDIDLAEAPSHGSLRSEDRGAAASSADIGF
jgi:Bifunctional DNA primase/polymerase, N-terminal